MPFVTYEERDTILRLRLKKLNVFKSCGSDGLLSRILPEARCILAKPLKLIFEVSLRHQVTCNTTDVSVMYKKANENSVFKGPLA